MYGQRLRRQGFAVLTAAACACVFNATAGAQAEEDVAAARALFDDARHSMKSGDYDAACPKLLAASAHYRGSGIFLNLGDCYEKTGRTASAWAAFGEAEKAASLAERVRDQAEAHRRRALLDTRLSRIAIVVPERNRPMTIACDGATVVPAHWGIPIPVDPGLHLITAQIDGRPVWSASVVAQGAGATFTVEVPEFSDSKRPASDRSLETEAADPSPAARDVSSGAGAASSVAPQPRTPPPWTRPTGERRAAAIGLGSAGLSALATSAVLVFAARQQFDGALGQAGTARQITSQNAVKLGNIATVAFTAGASMLAAATFLWFTVRTPSASIAIGPGQVRIDTSF